MKKPNYSCVIFDMDGTLLYTIDDIAKSVNITLKEFGYPEKTIEEVTSFVNNGAYRLMELALPEDKRDKETVTTVLNRYLDIYDEHVCEKTHPYDGIAELVETLRNSGIKLAGSCPINPTDRLRPSLSIASAKACSPMFRVRASDFPPNPIKRVPTVLLTRFRSTVRTFCMSAIRMSMC